MITDTAHHAPAIHYPYHLALLAGTTTQVVERALSREQARDLARLNVYQFSERAGQHVPADFVIVNATTGKIIETVRVP